MKKYHDNGLEKHRKLQALNSDRNPTGRILTPDVQQHRKKKEFKEQKIAYVKESSFTNASHKN